MKWTIYSVWIYLRNFSILFAYNILFSFIDSLNTLLMWLRIIRQFVKKWLWSNFCYSERIYLECLRETTKSLQSQYFTHWSKFQLVISRRSQINLCISLDEAWYVDCMACVRLHFGLFSVSNPSAFCTPHPALPWKTILSTQCLFAFRIFRKKDEINFYCRSYCLLNMFRASLCPSSGAQEYYTVVAACGWA